jgi:formylglycine-generating enzyme required for sulfatase activity
MNMFGWLKKKKPPVPEDSGEAVRTGSGRISGVGRVESGENVVTGAAYENIAPLLKMKGFAPSPELKPLRQKYFDYLYEHYHALDSKGIPQLETITKELPLEDIYVPLLARPEMPAGETWPRYLAGRALGMETLPADLPGLEGKAPAAPQRVEELLGKSARVVVIGDPGSGKTTLLKILALRLRLENDAPLPILLPLSAYAEALAQEDIPLHLFFGRYFAKRIPGAENIQDLFASVIAGGQALMLLDGLDEVQDERQRKLLKSNVETFAGKAVQLKNRVVLTSRIVGYKESPLEGPNWEIFTLLDFDDNEIEQFSRRWCLAVELAILGDTPLAQERAEIERLSLLEAIQAHSGVRQLASNPLLLTILALIKRQGVTLPNRRVQLYELYMQTLVSAWAKARGLDKQPVGPPVDYLRTVKVLDPLALWLREENPTAGLVPQERLLEWLTDYYMGEEWGLKRNSAEAEARGFLDSVHKYSSLLLERGQGRFGFIHLTLEEYLAGRGLVQKGQLDLDDSLAYIRKYLTDAAWRETILLAVGVWGLVREQPLVAGKVVGRMLEMDCEGADACRNVLMAGACLEDVGELGLGRIATNEVIEALLAASRDRSLLPATQRDAGFTLGRLANDPSLLERIRPDLDALIQIPAGSASYPGEERPIMIEHPFEMAKYLVTNLQYKAFVDAGGYEDQDVWSADGWAWRTGSYDSQAPKEYRDWLAGRPAEKRGEPFFWHDSTWNNPLAPVVGVSWFEAVAYCKWLTREKGRLFRLPTEDEWEWAARGDQGREFPWGKDFDRLKLNCAEFWSGAEDLSDYEEWKKWFGSDSFKAASTTLVGQFAQGNTPVGASDLSGNVWEWTASWFDEKSVERVLRGGAWYYNRRSARCACRGRLIPDYFDSSVGFRVVSPGSISGA